MEVKGTTEYMVVIIEKCSNRTGNSINLCVFAGNYSECHLSATALEINNTTLHSLNVNSVCE